MNQVMESVLTVCVALVAAELLRRFFPEDQMVRFVSGLSGDPVPEYGFFDRLFGGELQKPHHEMDYRL